MTPIIEQLKEYCNCIDDIKDDDKLERNVNELIHLISLMTCWTQEPCETFLNSERKEVVDVEPFNPCCCDGGIIEFKPFYHPFNPLTFKVYLVRQEGIEETSTELTDFAYSDTFGVLRINLREAIKNFGCGCPNAYRLVITYDAGYELIPDCLLQLFCDLLHVIYDKNNCSCETCQSCKAGDNDVVVEFSEGDKVSPKLETYLNTLVKNAYQKQLGLISICKALKPWGIVV